MSRSGPALCRSYRQPKTQPDSATLLPTSQTSQTFQSDSP